MSQLTLLEGLLANLRGDILERRREYLPKKEALAQLKHHTGQDFGEDVAKWAEWIQLHPQSIRRSSVDVSSRANKFLSGVVVRTGDEKLGSTETAGQ